MLITKKEIIVYKKKFGLHLKNKREELSLSQLDLASRMNVEKTAISRIENGRTNITLVTAIKISKALDIDLKELFDLD